MIRDSPSTIQGVGSDVQAAPTTVDGMLQVCSQVVFGQAPSWIVTLGSGRMVSSVIVYVNGKRPYMCS